MAILTQENYVDKAEKVVTNLIKKRNGKYELTTSKLRKLLSLTSELYNELGFREYNQLKERVSYLRVQFVYQAGREISVADLLEKGEILECLKEVNDNESLALFCRYMEAIVAYFKFYKGDDM